MQLSHSLWRKVTATAGAIGAFVVLYQATMLDSRRAAEQAALRAATASPALGVRLQFAATAYCRGTTTASGVGVRTGIAASDPALLPVGSVVQVSSLGPQYNGIYTILDTGPKVRGRHIDIYLWNCDEALRFGRRPAQVTVLRLGWNPQAVTPAAIDTWLRRKKPTPAPLPSRPRPTTEPVVPRS